METANLLLPLALILVLAKVAALASSRLKLPTVFSELLVGVILGPSVLGILSQNDFLKVVSNLGVIILMFIAGLETDLKLMRKVGAAAFLAATGGVITPLVLGTVLGLMFGLPLFVSLFIGTALTATSVSISAETLQELGKLRSREGTAILGAAVIDDVMGVVVLAVVLSANNGSNIWFPLVKMIGFFVVATIIGIKLLPWLNKHLLKWHSHAEEAVLATILAFVLFYAWAAEELGGVAAITGAYLMGVLLSRLEIKSKLDKGVRSIGYGFFIPIFFVNIGLQSDFSSMISTPALTFTICILAVFSKIIGCFAGAWLGRMKAGESLLVGIGMISRGEVALVIAVLGLNQKIIDGKVFATIVFMIVFTTVITPLLLKISYTIAESKNKVVVPHSTLPGSVIGNITETTATT